MRRGIAKIMILMLIALAILPGITKAEYIESGTTTYVMPLWREVDLVAIKAYDAPIWVLLYNTYHFIDSIYVEAGSSVKASAKIDKVVIHRTLATAVQVLPAYERGTEPGFAPKELTTLDIEWIPIVNWYSLPDSTFMTFPAPMVWTGGRNIVAYSLRCDPPYPDTMFVQLATGTVMFDTTNVFDFGSKDNPVNMLAYDWSEIVEGSAAELTQYIENRGAGWLPTAFTGVTNRNMFTVFDGNGNGISSKYTGLRVSGGQDAIVNLVGWLGLAKVGAVGGGS